MKAKGGIDRLAMRARPPGSPVMQQRWNNLLFLHWPVDPARLRPLVPSPLEIDTFEGQAWVGITPFHLDDLQPLTLPPLPGLNSFHELNLRTYVVYQGIPGIWFFSLDASKLIPAAAARLLFMLPYFKARIRFVQGPQQFAFSLHRTGPPAARFSATWQVGSRLRAPDLESLAFFLVERYCAFAVEGRTVSQIRIYHHPWILDEAQVRIRSSTLFSGVGLPEPTTEPLAHFSKSLKVEVWLPAPASTGRQREGVRVPVS